MWQGREVSNFSRGGRVRFRTTLPHIQFYDTPIIFINAAVPAVIISNKIVMKIENKNVYRFAHHAEIVL